MSRRPLPIAPPTRQEVDAGWSAIKAGLETGGAGQWRLAWILAASVLFVGVTAGATVLVRELRERNRVERARHEPARAEATTTTHEPSTSTPAAPSEGPSGSGSLSPVVPAANGDGPEDGTARGARRDDATSTGRPKSQARAPAGKSAGGAGGPAASNGGARAVSDDARGSGRGYSPFAGMSPKTRSDDDTSVDSAKGADDGSDTFAAGSAARARGDFGNALAHYERFVSKHPHDERAGIAAIEAARILADHLEQPTKALRWAERAVELSAQGSVREDARARVVQLLGTLKRPRCATAQREFLRDYPNSVHAPRVQRACSEAP